MKACVFALGAFLLLAAGMVAPSFAHTTISVDKYDIEAGWGVEPPIVGLRNSLVVSVQERGEIEGQYTGVTHAMRGMEATAFYGGESKVVSFSPEDRPGHYYSPIIPTKTGTYLVQLQGDLRGTPVDIKIPIEDVEHTDALDFPPVPGGSDGGGGGADAAEVAAMKKAITALQQDVSRLNSGGAVVPSGDGGDGGSGGGGMAYDFAVMGLSMSAAAIVLGVVALVRKGAG